MVTALLVTLPTGCSGSGPPAPAPASPTAGVSPGTSQTGAPPSGSSATGRRTAARPVPRPPARACYRLGYDEAVAPTVDRRPVPCSRPHTSVTFLVGELDSVVRGHLVAIDSDRVQAQVASVCPRRLVGFLGGTREQRRLSMLRAVWFTPTVEESDHGANWFRCDVIAVAATGELAPLRGRVAGVLGTEAGRDRYGMCGTAEPGTDGFRRVICSAGHSWRAVSTVDLPGGGYPGERVVRAAGEDQCTAAGRAAAADPLDFRWGYEWPTREQWESGQTYGICWAPA